MASQQLEQSGSGTCRDTQPRCQIGDVITALCNSKKGADSTGRDGPAWHVKRR